MAPKTTPTAAAAPVVKATADVASAVETGATAAAAVLPGAAGDAAAKVASAAASVAAAAGEVAETFLPALDKIVISVEKIGAHFHASVKVNDREATHKDTCLDGIISEIKTTLRRFGAILPKTRK